jgi:hypothetical protein
MKTVAANFDAEPESAPGESGGKAGGKRAPRPPTWPCLGSDLEMEAERMRNARELVECLVSRRRSKFGAPAAFADRDSHDSYLEFRPFRGGWHCL